MPLSAESSLLNYVMGITSVIIYNCLNVSIQIEIASSVLSSVSPITKGDRNGYDQGT
jgi:hypothetical protein